MNIIHVLAFPAILTLTAGCRAPSRPFAAPATSETAGAWPVSQTLALLAGSSDVRLVVGEPNDSVRWSLVASPAGCAAVHSTPKSLQVATSTHKCRVTWNVAVPGVEYVDVQASVGDIALMVLDKRAVRMATSVGRVRMRIDGSAIRAPDQRGSGDQLAYGDEKVGPRVVARTHVGSISADIRPTGAR